MAVFNGKFLKKNILVDTISKHTLIKHYFTGVYISKNKNFEHKRSK